MIIENGLKRKFIAYQNICISKMGSSAEIQGNHPAALSIYKDRFHFILNSLDFFVSFSINGKKKRNTEKPRKQQFIKIMVIVLLN